MNVTGVGVTSSLVVQSLGDMRTQLADLQRQLGTGQRSTTYAGLGIDRGLVHPEVADPEDDPTRLLPIYPISGKLRSDQIRRAVRLVLDVVSDVPDALPPALREKQQFCRWRAGGRKPLHAGTGVSAASSRRSFRRASWSVL